MNELLQKFARQVGFGSDENGEIYTSALEHLPITEDLDAFAELIVRECVAIVDDMADPEDSERYFWAIQNASQKIKKHFGVES